MVTFLVFVAISLLLVFPVLYFLLHLSLGISILLSFLSFFLIQFLFVVLNRIVAGFSPGDRPIEKRNPLGSFSAGFMLSEFNFLAGVRPVVTGKEKIPKEGRFLYVCNHRSMFDPLIVMDCLREYDISFISKPSNMQIPILSRVAYSIGYLAIDRENNRNALQTILTAADYMKKDICSIAIYPEGTRSKTNELLPFHAGSFKTAQKAKVPIVAACIHGSENIRKPKPFSPTKVYLDILEVIPAETVCAMRTDALSEHVRSIIQEDLDRADAEAYS